MSKRYGVGWRMHFIRKSLGFFQAIRTSNIGVDVKKNNGIMKITCSNNFEAIVCGQTACIRILPFHWLTV